MIEMMLRDIEIFQTANRKSIPVRYISNSNAFPALGSGVATLATVQTVKDITDEK
jgi:hypothetical protein